MDARESQDSPLEKTKIIVINIGHSAEHGIASS
jgi:hypothetical protein